MFFKFIENFLTKEECDKLILMGESIDLIQMKSSLVINGKVITENADYSGNKRMGCYFTNEMLEDAFIKEISKKIINLSNEINPFNGITYTDIFKYSFNRYGIDDFLDWHPDKHELINGATITYIIQLNDDYENGEVKYLINDIEYSVPKKTGSIFIFDSNISHSVVKITNGNRYSINVWPMSKIIKSLI